MRRALILAACLCLTGPVWAEGAGEVEISHVTGKPVPRFEALRFAAANGRTGPSEDHPIAWRYERPGLPMLILKESRDWRFVRDPDGDEVWMHERMLARADTALTLSELALHASPDPRSAALARVEAGVLLRLGRCEGAFCHVESGPHSGWAALASLWGAGLSSGLPEGAAPARNGERSPAF